MIRAVLRKPRGDQGRTGYWVPCLQRSLHAVPEFPESFTSMAGDQFEWFVENWRLICFHAQKTFRGTAITEWDMATMFLPDVANSLKNWRPDGGASKSTYVGVSVRHRALYRLDRCRFFRRTNGNKRNNLRNPLLIGDLLPESAEPPESEIDHDLIVRARQALESLSGHARAVADLCFVEGLSLREAAAVLGVSYQYVHHGYGRAVSRMRHFFFGDDSKTESADATSKMVSEMIEAAHKIETPRQAYTFVYIRGRKLYKGIVSILKFKNIDPADRSMLEWQLVRIRALARDHKRKRAA